jgi:catechol 2,3-dioxygenase-like lactoylglutathione lyase family enzyme
VLTSHATVLLVPDVLAALEWWRDALGFETKVYEGGDFYGYARRDGVYVHFSKCPDVRPNSVASPPDLFDLYVYVDDVEALYDELRGRGAEILHPPTDRAYGMREIRVRDPHGYVLGIGQPLAT